MELNYLSTPKLQRTVGVWEWMSNFISHYNECNYLTVLESKLIFDSKTAIGLANDNIFQQSVSIINYAWCWIAELLHDLKIICCD